VRPPARRGGVGRSLRACPDASAASWIATSDLPWHRLVTFGTAGFDAYARLRFLPDPRYDGQPEVRLDEGAPFEYLLAATLEVLGKHTRAPEDVSFCIWTGWGTRGVPPEVLDGPRVDVPNRSYFLVRGALTDVANWAPGDVGSDEPRLDLATPAFIWPTDHAWCVACDVDPHYAGIGAGADAVADLLAHPGLDVVVADPLQEQPHYH
jgi:hypothetical protein